MIANIEPLSPVDPYASRFAVMNYAIEKLDALIALRGKQVERLQKEAKNMDERLKKLEGE